MDKPTTSLQKLDLALPIGSLDAYVAQVNRIPMLSLKEEQDLGTRLQNTEDLEAARQLVMAHLRYVVKVARGYLGYGLPLGDLIQEGNVGLMKAVKRFDPKVGVRLVTFAMHWIKAEIHEFVLRNWKIVKFATTKAKRKLFFNLRRMKKNTEWLAEKEISSLSEDLDINPKTIREMESCLGTRDASFDGGATTREDDEHSFTPAAYLEDNRYNPEASLEESDWSDQSKNALHGALSELDTRSQDILQARWLNDKKMTLQHLAKKYAISAERVRQLEKNALKKLRTKLASMQSSH